MQRRRFLQHTTLAMGGWAIPSLVRSESASDQPNFLFLLVDDLGWTDLGCYGSSFYETPNIDRLCARGVQFTQAYVTAPLCSPTRASLMTGKVPTRLGITNYIAEDGHNQPDHWQRATPFLPAGYTDRLALEEKLLPEALGEAGYETFFCGKWHLGPAGYWPEDQGFETNIAGCEWGSPRGPNVYYSPYGNPRLVDGPVGEYLPDRLVAETCRFLRSEHERSFFAYHSFYLVHGPHMAPPDLVEKYARKQQQQPWHQPAWGKEGEHSHRLTQGEPVYAAMVEVLDRSVGIILDQLDASGLTKETVIVFISDNGAIATKDRPVTSNLPLRAGKSWLYEGGIRVPLIISWPDRVASGRIEPEPVICTDLYPTLLDLSGQPLCPEQHLDGVSLAPLLSESGHRLPQRDFCWHFPHYGNRGSLPTSAIRSGDWKLIENLEDGRLELYNLAADISESNNLASAEPSKAEELLGRLKTWRQTTGARMLGPVQE